MPKTIDIPTARALLQTRDELLAEGRGEREIAALVKAGTLRRVRRGRYVDAGRWRDLWNEGRHLVEVIATHANSDEPGPVFWGPSAAVLHGLPLHRLAPENVHAVIGGARHGKTRTGVAWHDVDVPAADVVEFGGIRCTSLDRTVLDMACTTSAEAALSAADAALRREAVDGHVQDPDLAREWIARMTVRAERIRVRGIRQARRVIAFADGRAQLPGESVSRLQLSRLGYAGIALQVHVVGPEQEDYWLDFGFPRSRCFGEFDGTGKYLDEEMRGDRTIEQVVLDEKRREDTIRGVTGWRTARWGSADIRTLETFGRRLLAFGIRPPG